MEVRFLGPLGVVTGSCTWMRDMDRDWSFLVDCGLQQGERTQEEWNQCDWPFDPATLKFVVLTHAHTDHCGLLPVLYQRGFTGPVYCTKETAGLAKALLLDSTGHTDLYTEADVARVQWKEPGAHKPLGEILPVDQDLFLRFFRSGHIVGAVSVAVLWGSPGGYRRVPAHPVAGTLRQ
ncbi:MAG: MBL fold metallo-hydrolase [Pseudomonadota bacterium]